MEDESDGYTAPLSERKGRRSLWDTEAHRAERCKGYCWEWNGPGSREEHVALVAMVRKVFGRATVIIEEPPPKTAAECGMQTPGLWPTAENQAIRVRNAAISDCRIGSAELEKTMLSAEASAQRAVKG